MVQPGAGWHGWKADEYQVASDWQMLSGSMLRDINDLLKRGARSTGIFLSNMAVVLVELEELAFKTAAYF